MSGVPGEFGSLLREARKARGLSQRDLAAAAGLHFTYVSKLERGRLRSPSVRSVLRFAAVLEIDPLPLLRTRRAVPAALADLSAAQWAALSEWLAGGIF